MRIMDGFVAAFAICFILIRPTQACSTVNNPCLDNSGLLPIQTNRCPTCGAGDYCDKFYMLDNTWYRFDYVITTTPVAAEKCGTIYPIWMNGTFPEVSDEVVDRIGCLSTHRNWCEKEYGLMLRNCSTYHVYCLKELPDSCPQRYCFESPPLTTTTTTTAPTTTEKTENKEHHDDAQEDIERNDRMVKECSGNVAVAILVSVAVCAVIFGCILFIVTRFLQRIHKNAAVPSDIVERYQPQQDKRTLTNVDPDILGYPATTYSPPTYDRFKC